MNILIRLGTIAFFLVSLCSCQLLREPRPLTPAAASPNPTLPVVSITADEAARAMEADRFFSNYGAVTLRIQGTVFSVKRQGNNGLIIGLETTVPTKVMCNLGNYLGIVRVGSHITIQSANPRQDASRQASAIMFKDCTIP